MSKGTMNCFQVYDDLNDAISKTVKIGWPEVLRLVIDDLTEKYKSNVEHGETEWADAFLKVLSYYLTEDEIAEVALQTSQDAV